MLPFAYPVVEEVGVSPDGFMVDGVLARLALPLAPYARFDGLRILESELSNGRQGRRRAAALR